jgi:hypothetical protein
MWQVRLTPVHCDVSPNDLARRYDREVPPVKLTPVLDLMQRVPVVNSLRTGSLGRLIRAKRRARAEASTGNLTVEARQLVTSDEPTAVGAVLQLERACREAGLLHTAEQVLRRGLADHPGDSRVRMRLLDLLALRKQCVEAVDLWKNRTSDDEKQCLAITYVRASRCLREVGENARAYEVIADAYKRWPGEQRVWDEYVIARAESVSWEKALRPVSVADPNSGTVTALGFLRGGLSPLSGSVPPQGNPAVSIMVNDVPIAATSAAQDSADGQMSFSLRGDDMLHFLGDGDVISVQSGGSVMQCGGGAAQWEVQTGYQSRFAELEAHLASGHVFTKFGALKPSHTAESKAAMLALFDDVSEILRDETGYELYPFYGNLLGAIREGDFVAHDVGAFDAAYVSRHTSPAEVRQEFIAVCKAMVAHGIFLRVEPWSTSVRQSYRSRVLVDLNFIWFDDGDELHVSAGSRHRRASGRSEFRNGRTASIDGHTVAVPGNAEDVLRQLYGPSWQVVNQGFDLHDGLQKDEEYLLTDDEIAELVAIDPDRVQGRL